MLSMLPNLTSSKNINRNSLSSSSSSLSSVDDRNVTSKSVKILTWLRICNLLSELEAVAGQIGWEPSSSQEFKKIADLCSEIICLVNRSSTRMEFLSKLEKPRIHATNKTLVYIPDFFVNAIIFWLLNDLNVNTRFGINKEWATEIFPQSNSYGIGIMPHSINANLCKPLMYSILSMNSPVDQETASRFAQLLNATIWCIIDNAPSRILSCDRFWSICEVYSRIYFQQNKSHFLQSDLLISMCTQNSLHLPLLFISLSRMDHFYRLASLHRENESMLNTVPSVNEYNVIIADCLHWLHSVGICCMNGIDDQSFQLNGWILFLNFVINLITKSKINSFTNEPCCSKHPAWCSPLQLNDNNNDSMCASEFHCKRLSSILTEFKNTIITKLKAKQSKLTGEQTRQLTKLYTFVDCLCCLLDAWMISTCSKGFKNLEKFCSQSSSSSHFEAGKINNDTMSMEEGNSLKEMKSCKFEYEDHSLHESTPISSIISSLIIRLKSFTLLEAYRYLCLQFWTDLKPYVKQILQICFTPAQVTQSSRIS
ncbi:unnamed protein product [Heterobilharzia americana]|nr:unnamed protein product [Heterobilharzia americana]